MPSNDQAQSGRPSVLTLVIASVSSVAAALLVRQVWGPGTLIGAAVTPIIITLVGELLQRPAERVRSTSTGTQVREPAASRARAGAASSADPYDPVAAGRAGLASGAEPPLGVPAPRTTVRRRGRVWLAVVAGLVAFVIGGVLLTGSELIFGDSSVGSSSGRTTLLGGRSQAKTTKTKTKTPATTTTVTTTSESTTTAPPATTTKTTPATTAPTGPTAATPTGPTATTTPPAAAPAPATP